MEYSPKPILPSNPYKGMTSTVGFGKGADIQGFMPERYIGGMNSDSGSIFGIGRG